METPTKKMRDRIEEIEEIEQLKREEKEIQKKKKGSFGAALNRSL